VIGNDVIDLNVARLESNWQRPGFLSKIFSVKEQFYIETAKDQEQMVWKLWSQKEAVYKIFNRETGTRVFNPIQFECSIDTIVFGKVNFKDKNFFTKTLIDNDKIYTIAVTDPKYFSAVLELKQDHKIFKREGLPFIRKEESGFDYPISVTHHGKFWQAAMLDQIL
jgi:phosphopantetheinyl transferase (holo-ACP synthase)